MLPDPATVVAVEEHELMDDKDGNLESAEEEGSAQNSVQGDNGKPIAIGMVFASPDEAYRCYNEYARRNNFGIRIHSSRFSKVNGLMSMKQYVCNREGFKKAGRRSASKKDSDAIRRFHDSRTGCRAMMEICLAECGRWAVSKFSNDHNHDTTSLSLTKYHRSHRKLHRSVAMTSRALLPRMCKSGLRSSQMSKPFGALSTPQQIDASPTQVEHIDIADSQVEHTDTAPALVKRAVGEEGKKNTGRDCYDIICHFQKKAEEDPTYYFSVNFSADGALRNVFWADGRCRTSYMKFGDVLLFDVTYKTNKLQIPFVSFLGISQHLQPMLFGAALVEDESEETFTWLFEQFKKCMLDVSSLAIITDQDGAMCNAIKKVFPSSRHRFSSWHMRRNMLEHLQSYRSSIPNFDEEFKSWSKSETIEEFERLWETLHVQWKVQPDCWLHNLYNMRHHWVKAYLKDTFFAGMTSSSRCESMLGFFDGFLNSTTALSRFVCQYDNAVEDRRMKETLETQNPELEDPHPIERKAASCYTRTLFEVFEKQWKASVSCSHSTISKDSRDMQYLVGPAISNESGWHKVTYFSLTLCANCSCCKFQTFGMPCKHILYILRKKKLDTLPDSYILPRWCIGARSRNYNQPCDTRTSEVSAEQRLFSALLETLESVRGSSSKMLEFERYIRDFKNQNGSKEGVTSRAIQTNFTSSSCATQDNPPWINFGSSPFGTIVFCDRDAPVITKGRPKSAFGTNGGIEITNETKKKRTCGFCAGKGHYQTSCPKKKLVEGDLWSNS